MHPHESLIRTHVEARSERERQESTSTSKVAVTAGSFLVLRQDLSETGKELRGRDRRGRTACAKECDHRYEEGKLDAETSLTSEPHALLR